MASERAVAVIGRLAIDEIGQLGGEHGPEDGQLEGREEGLDVRGAVGPRSRSTLGRGGRFGPIPLLVGRCR